MRSEIKELHQRLQTTTIYVTHDQIEAMTMADKIVVMKDGRIEQSGSPLDLYDRPNNLFVAGFIGSPAMNFIKGSMTDVGFRTEDGIILPSDRRPGDAVTYGIRPEHLRLDPGGIEITTVVVEPTGSETLVIARLGTQTISCVFRERIRAAPGDVLKVAPIHDAVHLFDEGEQRIVSGEARLN
jgi:multiple sugar transport system ATP-binding protein